MKDLLAARMMNAQTAGTLNTLPRKEGPQEIRSSQEDEAKDSNNGTEGDTRDDDVLPNLISIDIADNDIDASGASHLAELLKQAKTLLRLDVSYNPLGDDGCRTLFAAMAPPNPDFLEDPGAEAKDERYNSSLTYADFSCCGLAHYAAEQLLDMFRTNQILHTLILDANPAFEAKDMKHFFNAIRSYGRYLQHLSVCDNNMSSKSVGYLCRALEEVEVPLKHLQLAHCGMLSTHASYLANSLAKNHRIDTLNISSNKLGEDGVDRLAEVLYINPQLFVQAEKENEESLTEDERLRRTFVDHTEVTTYAQLAEQEQTAEEKEEHKKEEHLFTLHKGVVVPGPPLVTVDASYCSLQPVQAKALLRALCSRPTLRIVRMSGNNIGDGMDEIISDVQLSYLVELQLNQCNLMSKSTNALFTALSDTSGREGSEGNTLGKSLRALYLANNDIHDSSVEPLGSMMASNHLLEHLDLGFNQFSAEAGPRLKEISMVTSTSSAERKFCPLTVNLIGNRCDAYSMDLPGLSRSKMNFRFGIKEGNGDGANDGYSHVQQVSRKHFFLRQAAYTDKLMRGDTSGSNGLEMGSWRINNVS